MQRRWTRIVMTLVMVAAVGSGLGAATAAASPPGSRRTLWTGTDLPPDLRTFDEGPSPAIDQEANELSDLSADPGPIEGQFGCGSIPVFDVGQGEFFEFDGAVVGWQVDTAQLCRAGGTDLVYLVMSGRTYLANTSTVVGGLSMRFVRGGPDLPFVRTEVDFTDANVCYTIGPTDGFPGDGTIAADYILQGWNFAGDPTIDCASRTLATTTTTTTAVPTSSTTSSTSSTSTTQIEDPGVPTSTTVVSTTAPTGVSSGQAAVPATPVSGQPTFTG